MSQSFEKLDDNIGINPIKSYRGTDGSLLLSEERIASFNFDGDLPIVAASVAISEVQEGQFITFDSASSQNYYSIVKIERQNPDVDSPYTGEHVVYYLDGNITKSVTYAASNTTVVVAYEDWDDKILGNTGWLITQQGNAIFSNVAVRGRIEATEGYIGNADSGWEITSNLLSNASVGFYAPSAFSGTDIAIFSGSPFANRATAPFRINYAGQMFATGASISGALTATTLDVGGANGIIYNGSAVTIGASVTINAPVTVNSLQVGASPTLLRIADDVQGTNDGIYIDPYNFWYSDGKFSVGGSANSACWNGSALSVKGNIVATSGSFTGDITAAAGRFTGSVTVDSGGKFIAGNLSNGVLLDDTGLYGYSNGTEMFKIPTTGSPTLAGFTIINTGLTGSGTNANIIIGENVGASKNNITIRGDKTSGSPAAIFTTVSGNPTSSGAGNGFYIDDTGRMRLAGSNGSLTFDGNNLSVTGSVDAQRITASVGSLGGWQLTASSIVGGTAGASVVLGSDGSITLSRFGLLNITAARPTYAMWTGSDPDTSLFALTYTGNLRATSASVLSAVVSGSFSAETITASNGTVGGWSLTASFLAGQAASIISNGNIILGTTANDLVRLSSNNLVHRLWVGDQNSNSASFRVTKEGALFAQGASIVSGLADLSSISISSSLSVNTNTLFADGGTNRVGIGTITPASALHVSGAALITTNLNVNAGTFYVNSTTNRVGVLTTSPASALHVAGGLLINNNASIGGVFSVASANIGGSGSTLYVTGNAFISNNLNVDSGTLYVDATNNEVGVLTTTPASALHIAGGLLVNNNASVGGIFSGASVNIGGSGSTLYVAGNAFISNNLNVDSGALYVDASTGNVGIGLTNPNTKFTVLGAASVTGNLSIGGTITGVGNVTISNSSNFAPQFILENTNSLDNAPYFLFRKNFGASASATSGMDLGTIMFQGPNTAGAATNSAYIASESAGQSVAGGIPSSLQFYTGNSAGTSTLAAILTSTQRLGIATSTPASALHVVGGAYVTGAASFGGTITGTSTTQASGDDSTSLATTAFVSRMVKYNGAPSPNTSSVAGFFVLAVNPGTSINGFVVTPRGTASRVIVAALDVGINGAASAGYVRGYVETNAGVAVAVGNSVPLSYIAW